MNIGIEVGWGQKTGGARTVAFSLIEQLLQLTSDDNLYLFSNTPWGRVKSSRFNETILPSPGVLPQVVFDQFVFPHFAMPRAARKKDLDVIHFTNNYISIYPPAPAVVTIHDLTPFVIPDAYRTLHRKYQQWYIARAAERADFIVTDSDSSRLDITNILGTDPARISVVPCAVDHNTFQPVTDAKILDRIRSRYKLPERFILFVGTLAPRKNADKILLALARIKNIDNKSIPLVISGRGGFQDPGLEQLARANQLQQQVIFTGAVDYADMAGLYSAARALVYPSRYEGFGLPVLEAFACGTPVITSNVSSLPEVSGDAALTVDPQDIDGLAENIKSLWDDDRLAEELSGKGIKRAQHFSWTRAAKSYLDIYRQAAALKR
jgi:glycosyltransferase involved in cell wall biosynthesis